VSSVTPSPSAQPVDQLVVDLGDAPADLESQVVDGDPAALSRKPPVSQDLQPV